MLTFSRVHIYSIIKRLSKVDRSIDLRLRRVWEAIDKALESTEENRRFLWKWTLCRDLDVAAKARLWARSSSISVPASESVPFPSVINILSRDFAFVLCELGQICLGWSFESSSWGFLSGCRGYSGLFCEIWRLDWLWFFVVLVTELLFREFVFGFELFGLAFCDFMSVRIG